MGLKASSCRNDGPILEAAMLLLLVSIRWIYLDFLVVSEKGARQTTEYVAIRISV